MTCNRLASMAISSLWRSIDRILTETLGTSSWLWNWGNSPGKSGYSPTTAAQWEMEYRVSSINAGVLPRRHEAVLDEHAPVGSIARVGGGGLAKPSRRVPPRSPRNAYRRGCAVRRRCGPGSGGGPRRRRGQNPTCRLAPPRRRGMPRWRRRSLGCLCLQGWSGHAYSTTCKSLSRPGLRP
jgi:hypothetical protein